MIEEEEEREKEKEKEAEPIPENFLDRAFGVVYTYRNILIENEEYEEVIALDKLIAYVKNVLTS